MQDKIAYADIIEYYDQSEIDYRLVWHLDSHLAMHYGFWDKQNRTLRAALHNENAVLAQLAGIKKSDYVLDAGCGVGGSSLFLAQGIGCRVLGISLSQKQIKTARQAATKKGLSKLARFEVSDFTDTGLPDASFDVVWAIESVCHADERSDFLREAFRVLKPGGRLVVADGFAVHDKFAPKDDAIMHRWLSGWSVRSLETLPGFRRKAEKIGFVDVTAEDYTPKVIPSAKRLYRMSLLEPFEWLTRKFGIRGERTRGNFVAAKYQYIALRKHLWQYGVVCARKP